MYASQQHALQQLWQCGAFALLFMHLWLTAGFTVIQGPRQGGFPHSTSRRRTACDAAIDPPGPPPCLVLGPDGTPLALAIQEIPTENPLKAFQASSTPETNKGANAELDQLGNQIQVCADKTCCVCRLAQRNTWALNLEPAHFESLFYAWSCSSKKG